MTEPRIVGLELGGTKCLAILATGRTIERRVVVPTTTPAATLGALDILLDEWWRERKFEALGIASFGPLGLDPARGDFGRITTTPKPAWAGTDILGRYRAQFQIPIGFDTDVTGAALAEFRWGAAQATSCNVYMTIGTGIGGGAIVNGKPLRGLLHPEMGHIRIRRIAGDRFAGTCPSHGDCFEGLVAGPAITARAGRSADRLSAEDRIWELVSADISEALAMIVLTLSPQRIALGGGVMMGQPQLYPAIRAGVAERLAGYVAVLDEAMLDRLIAPATFGADAGPLGAIALGLDALGI